mgnify:FL=1
MNFFNKQFQNVKEFTDFTTVSIRDLFTGNIFRKDILKKQVPLCLLIVFFVFCHIGLRYSCEGKILEIAKLNKVFEDVKHEANTESSELLGMSKQSRVQQMVQKKDDNLRPSQTPPIVIKK